MSAVPSLTQDQAAALRGITSRGLRKRVQAGNGPTLLPSGQLDPAEFGRWLRSEILSELNVGDDGEVYDYNAERARLTRNQADQAEIATAEMRGDVIRVSEVQKRWVEVAASVRAKLLGLPSRLAGEIAAPDQVAAVQAIASAVVNEALNEIADEGSAVGSDEAGPDRADVSGDVQTTAETDAQPVG